MTKKKDKVLTVLFSLLPGAGHMYMGFMKMGVSYMSAFFIVIFLSSWLDIGPLLFLIPVLWFYSFFDSINKRFSSDEEFAAYEDRYPFSREAIAGKRFQKSGRLAAGLVLLVLGVIMLWKNLLQWFSPVIPEPVYLALSSATRSAPQIIFAAIIIVIGVRLIMGKKKEAGRDA